MNTIYGYKYKADHTCIVHTLHSPATVIEKLMTVTSVFEPHYLRKVLENRVQVDVASLTIAQAEEMLEYYKRHYVFYDNSKLSIIERAIKAMYNFSPTTIMDKYAPACDGKTHADTDNFCGIYFNFNNQMLEIYKGINSRATVKGRRYTCWSKDINKCSKMEIIDRVPLGYIHSAETKEYEQLYRQILICVHSLS